MAEVTVDEILWTNRAKSSFNKIVKYLLDNWSEKEVSKIVGRTNEFLSVLQRCPEMYRPSIKRINVRIALFIKQAHTDDLFLQGGRA